MKTFAKKATAYLLTICLLVGFVPVFGIAASASRSVVSLGWTKKTTKLTADTTYTFEDLFGYSVDYGPASLTDLQNAITVKGLDNADMVSLLSSAISSVGKNLQGMTYSDIMSMTAKKTDDVVSFIFAGLKALGVDVDPAYEKISSDKVLGWFTITYYAAQAETSFAGLENAIAAKGLDIADMVSLLSAAISSVGKNFKAMSAEDILQMSEYDKADVVTFFFAGLKALGVSVDPKYEIRYAGTVLEWIVSSYVFLPSGTDELAGLQRSIADQGLDGTDMVHLLISDLTSVGRSFQTMTTADILNMTADETYDVVLFIFAGLKALGVKVDPVCERLASIKVLKWFVKTYVAQEMPVRLTCSSAEAVTIDYENQRVIVHKNAKKIQIVTFTLSASDPDSSAAAISYEAKIRTSKTMLDWIREIWQALRESRFREAWNLLKQFVAFILA